MKKVYEMVGEKYGKLTVIREHFLEKKHHNGPAYLCVCECGKEVVKLGLYLRNTQTPSCMSRGYCDREYRLYKYLYSGRVKSPSKRAGYESDISLDDFISLVKMPCHYCGIVGYKTEHDEISDAFVKYNGLDRVDPNIGYFKSNVVTACFACNEAKSNDPAEIFINQARKIMAFRDKRKPPDFSLSDKIVWLESE